MLPLAKLILITIFSFSLAFSQTDNDPVEWGFLDSLDGVYYLNDSVFTGSTIKQLEIGILSGNFLDGLKHGTWTILNRISEPIMIGEYNQGKKNGKFEQWYDDGYARKKELIATFKDDKYVDDYEEWYDNGNRSIKGFYIDGLEHGSYREWHYNGNTALKATFIKGKLDGWYKEWYDNGKKAIKLKYDEGKKNGLWTQWYDNGKKSFQVEYINDVARGKATFWYPNGSLRGEGIIVGEAQGGGWVIQDPLGERRIFK